MAINTQMSGAEIDAALKAFYEVMNTENNGKVIYIRNGSLSVEDGSALFDVVSTNQ